MKVITSVTPMSSTIGNGNPTGICRPPGGCVMPWSVAYWSARPFGQNALLANQARPSTTAQPTTPRSTSAHIGRDREAVAAPLAPAVVQQADDRHAAGDAEDPGDELTDRARAPPPMSWKVGSSPVTAAPCDWYQTRPRIDSRPPSVTMNDGTPM